MRICNAGDASQPEDIYIFQDKEGGFYRAAEIFEYFDGTAWVPWESRPADCVAEFAQAGRVRLAVCSLSASAAVRLFGLHMVPPEFQQALGVVTHPVEDLNNAVDEVVALMRLMLGELLKYHSDQYRSSSLRSGLQQMSNHAADRLHAASEAMISDFFVGK